MFYLTIMLCVLWSLQNVFSCRNQLLWHDYNIFARNGHRASPALCPDFSHKEKDQEMSFLGQLLLHKWLFFLEKKPIELLWVIHLISGLILPFSI